MVSHKTMNSLLVERYTWHVTQPWLQPQHMGLSTSDVSFANESALRDTLFNHNTEFTVAQVTEVISDWCWIDEQNSWQLGCGILSIVSRCHHESKWSCAWCRCVDWNELEIWLKLFIFLEMMQPGHQLGTYLVAIIHFIEIKFKKKSLSGFCFSGTKTQEIFGKYLYCLPSQFSIAKSGTENHFNNHYCRLIPSNCNPH